MKLKHLFLSCALLTSCDLNDLFKPSTPECYNKDTVDLVKQIINDYKWKPLDLDNAFDIQVNPKYELSYSKDTGTRTCIASGKLSVNTKASPKKKEFANSILPLYYGEYEIKYTVTVVKDKDGNYEQLVQIIND